MQPRRTTGLILTVALWAALSGCSRPLGPDHHPTPVCVFHLVPHAPHLRVRIVYQDARGVWLYHLPSGKRRLLVPGGRYPRWSPDGVRIACHDGAHVWVVDAANARRTCLAVARAPRALGWRHDGKAVLFSDGHSLKTVSTTGGPVRVILSGRRVRELSAERRPGRVALTLKTATGFGVYLLDLPSGNLVRISRGCSASLSPGGHHVTVNEPDHHYLRLVQIEPLHVQRVFTPEVPLDNHKWSNHPGWIAAVSDPPERALYLYDLSHRRIFRLPDLKNVDRPDLFVVGEAIRTPPGATP